MAKITTQSHSRSHSFMVRIWLEELGGDTSEWRGKVHHTLSGESVYFRDWPMLIAHLEKMLQNSERK